MDDVHIPERGVGVVYDPILDPLLNPELGLVDVIEVEPQTFFIERGGAGGSLDLHEAYLAHLLGWPQPKIVHSVGVPVGGSRAADPRQLPLLRRVLDELAPAWWSEHLAFNRADGPQGPFWTSFLLPPLLTERGLGSAIASVRALMALAPERPFAIETPVNYLRPRPGEMPYGEFVARVCEASGCGILLDLHNILANERNGREPVERVIEALPPERIWEIHLAGGFEMKGLYLDAHSDVCDEELTQLTRELVPRLPGLGALIFEMLQPFVERVGLEPIAEQLLVMRELWATRGSALAPEPRPRPVELRAPSEPADTQLDSAAWERALAQLVIGRDPDGDGDGGVGAELADDPGVSLMRYLVGTFRSGYLAESLPMTMRLLLMTVGEEQTRAWMQGFWDQAAPEIFASSESRRFASYLGAVLPEVPYLDEVLRVELAALAARIDGESTTLTLGVDPIALMAELGEGRVPEQLARGSFELVMDPD